MLQGRIKEAMDADFKAMSLPGIVADYEDAFQEMYYSNEAHTVMLCDNKIISKDVAKHILTALRDIQANLKIEDLTVDRGNDLYLNIESQLIERIGADEGGRMHTGRSRNDLSSNLVRMTTRRKILEIIPAIIELQKNMVDLAEKYKDAVFTGYTHMQPAQPTTVGHYFIMCANNLNRDVQRLIDAYANTNQCALGAAAFAGTGFPIDRMETAELLGFDKVIENSWDCVVSRDYALQVEAAYAIMDTNLSRMAQDMFIWCTDEFNVMELGGQISGTSSIMPQKKNPSPLEKAKANSGGGVAAFVDSAIALKNAPFGFCGDAFRVPPMIDKSHKDSLMVIKLLTLVTKYCTFHTERTEKMADLNFSTATSLADTLVRDYDISFRNAHHIVAGMVGDVKDAGQGIGAATTELLLKWSKDVLGREIVMTEEELQNALSARGNVDDKDSLGGPALSSMNSMIAHTKESIECEENWVSKTSDALNKAYTELEKIVDELIK